MPHPNTNNLVLVGFMGTGKTTVGKIIAKKMQRPFIDLDREIEKHAGQPIAQLFETQGEQTFRQLERHVVQNISAKPQQIIACGGGVILDKNNIHTLSQTGTIICLQASPSQILQRIATHTHRPLLQGKDRQTRLQKIYDQRKPLYDALPLQINTDGLSLDDVATRAQDLYQSE